MTDLIEKKPKTVKEVIDHLSKFPPDSPVHINVGGGALVEPVRSLGQHRPYQGNDIEQPELGDE